MLLKLCSVSLKSERQYDYHQYCRERFDDTKYHLNERGNLKICKLFPQKKFQFSSYQIISDVMNVDT